MTLRAVAVSPGQIAAEGGVVTLGNQGLPMLIPGSGLMIANGVGTLTTALASSPAITKCYCYFDVNQIASGVAAGWYYTVFTTTTAFTVFNNTYTSGTPAIPASPTAFSTVTPVSYTGSSSAIVAYNISVPGNLMGLNGGLDITFAGQTTNASGNKTYTTAYGSITLISVVPTTSAAIASPSGFRNMGATNAQLNTTNTSAAGFGTTSGTMTLGAVDTTAAQTFSITMTNSTPATNNMMLGNTTVKLIPSVA